MTNVAGREAYSEVAANLEKRLRDELIRTGDPRLIDDGSFFETPPMAGPTSGSDPGDNKSPAELRRGPANIRPRD
jgi:hypothetical protein